MTLQCLYTWNILTQLTCRIVTPMCSVGIECKIIADNRHVAIDCWYALIHWCYNKNGVPLAANTLNNYASLMCTYMCWYQTHPRPVHRNLQKGMGCQVKWYGGTHVSIQGWIQRLKKVVGTEWILVGVYITHSTLGGLGPCSPRKIFF